MGEKCS
jgi:hypothetical protein